MNSLFSSREKHGTIAQISEGIQRISDVVQNNSATSGESAASSQELSSLAHLLKGLVERFSLKQ